MKRCRPLTCLELLLLLALALACLAAVALGIGGVLIPRMAEERFGPPASSLGSLERVRGAVELMLAQTELTQPANPNGEEQTFQVALGESVASVAARLEAAGLIRSAAAFRVYLVYTGWDTSLQAGDYQLSPALSTVEIARKLQDATPEQVPFNILLGWRAEEIAAALPTSGLSVREDDFLRLVHTAPGDDLPPGWQPGMAVEGYLAPGSYQFSRDASADDLLRAFTMAFDQALDADLRAGFERQGLTLDEAVILASIVQREAVVVEEQPMIASVFFNRLAQGMKLDSDPTVQYALGYDTGGNSWWTNPLSAGDLQVVSPYNTYQNAGLPPGPICNPSLDALRAVAYPADTPYFYFRAACDGSGRHNFAVTYEEHIQNGCP
jgi:UPF0755 protein